MHLTHAHIGQPVQAKQEAAPAAAGQCLLLCFWPKTCQTHSKRVACVLFAAAGMLLFATINVFLHRIWHKVGFVNSITHVDLYASAMAPYGIAGGAVLLASMVCGILAGGDDAVQFSGAKVMAEASILVSGAWGVLLFQELRSLLQVLFWLLSMQMLCSYAIIIAGRVVSC